MDTYDVSNVPGYLEYLETHKNKLKNARALKGQTAMPQKSRDEILMQFMFRQMMKETPSACEESLQSLPPSIASFDDLKKVMIKSLCLETHHRGRYLLLRSITKTHNTAAAMFLVEDEDDNVFILQLYNHNQELSGAQILKEGTILLVKEPYVKVMVDGEYGIRVDHPSDVSFVPQFDHLVPLSWRDRVSDADEDAFSWKVEGSEYFNQNDFRSAIQCYSKGLETQPSPELLVILQLNRALCLLKNHCFEAALEDVEKVLNLSEKSEKGLFRKAQAFYQLRMFKESCETHAILARHYPGNTAAAHEYQRALARLAEVESGKYEFKKMILEAKKRRPPSLDRGTYIGPIAVKQTESHGRGLFTTAAVKAGDLLLCEKAFAHAFHNGDESQNLRLLIDVDMNKATIGTQPELIETISQKLYKNPSLIPGFVDLHHGTYEPVGVQEVDNKPIVDSFLVERIIVLNSFGCPLLSRAIHIHSMERVDDLTKSSNRQFHSVGIWKMASYINHSCMSNARRSFVGDMMIVRASMDLPADTEITFWYKTPLDCDPKELPLDLQQWGFTCDCALCQDTQNAGRRALSNRVKFLSEVETLLKKSMMNLRVVENLLLSLAGTYRRPAHEVPRLALYPSYLALATIYCSSNKPKKAVQFGLLCLESLGFVIKGGNIPRASSAPLFVEKWGLMTDGVVGCWMTLCRAYQELAPDLSPQAEGYARISYKICVGEDETFEQTYSMLSHRTDGFLVTAN
ncbi:hypothetical protein N7452_007873 [Penicillium brevicompactum]|uniref:SET domain-containing protein n=1 Tax=Penicillium brevicompactum TaxID=5074 RepID=A0A9W9UDX0_PENBR|nr:hypothetical protein N7452_007873 [Penicillium brevicompactum]